MIKTNPEKCIGLFLALFLWGPCYAQEVEKRPLRDVLNQIEEQFSVRFSYMDQPIDSIQVMVPGEGLALEQVLDYLEDKAGLEFVTLDENFISIKVRTAAMKICGYLLDESDDTPVADVLIYTQNHFTTSDSTGYFELPNLLQPSTIQAKHVSYQDRVLSYDPNLKACPRVYLTPSVSRLAEIIIENYLVRGIDKRENGQTVVDAQNTNILPGLTEPDVFFVLQNLPGIQSINETVTDINIRGGSNDQNLILWDGLKLYQTGHFFGLISAINPHIVGKTTLIKNGTPARLGEGVSGTIQVQTRDKATNEPIVQLGSNLINSDLLLDIPTSKLHLLIGARHSIGGLINTPTYQQYFNRAFRFSDVINDPNSQVINSDEKLNFYDVSLNATYRPSSAISIRGGLFVFDNGIEYEESALVSNEVESKVSNLDQSTMAGYLSYDRRWSNRLRTQLYSSVMNYKQESVNFDVLTGQEHVLENEVLETTIRAQGSYIFNGSWDIEGGLQVVETGIRNFRDINLPLFRSLSKDVLLTTSLYAEGHAQFQTHTNLTLGVRASYFDKLNKYRIEPRLAMVTRLGGPFSLEVLAETKSQTTTQVVDFQTDFLGVENRKWELVNGENIPLLTSNQASVGLNYRRSVLLVSLEGFIKEVEGVVTASQGFLNQFQFVRTSGSYVSRGFELLINPSFGSLDSWITYAYLDSDFTFPNLIPNTFRNNFDITHALSLGLTYQLNHLELSSGINYRSGTPFTRPIGVDTDSGDDVIFDTPNSKTLDPYFRMDFSAKYVFIFSEKWSGNVGLGVWNLTNKDNIINTLTTVNEGNELSQLNQMALGITPNLSLRIAYSLSE